MKLDLADRAGMSGLFGIHRFEKVVHLAAQAGVRYSIDNPRAYVDSNLEGFMNVLEGCRHNGCKHLLFASSSSVYGANTKMPFSVHDNVDHPVSLYAATKKSNELMAHAYSYNRLPAKRVKMPLCRKPPFAGSHCRVPRVMGPIHLLQSLLPLACGAMRHSAQAGRFPAANSQRMRRAGQKHKGSLRSSPVAEHSSASPSGLKPQGQFKKQTI